MLAVGRQHELIQHIWSACRTVLARVALLSLLGACGGQRGGAPTPTRTIAQATTLPVAPPATPAATATGGGQSARGLPTATLPTMWVGRPTPPPRCNTTQPVITGSNDPFTFASQAGKAWASDQVVAGIVEEQWARWELPGTEPLIATYSRLRVEGRARGMPDASLLVRTAGGTLDGCTQLVGNEASLRVGDRVVLFLRRSGDPASTEPLFFVVGGASARWRLTPDGQIAISPSELLQLPVADLLAEVRRDLGQPPPPDLDPRFIVPLDRAPIDTPPRP